MIKHAEGRHLASEDVMHFGLIPRSHRGIFCMNELPDLSPKIQVGLFNVLEERDVQIRGFPVRLDLDLVMVFSANPEDYTNRGRIVTPLKDRIGSEIRTHYPATRANAMAITRQEAWTERVGGLAVSVPDYVREVVEEVAFQARADRKVDKRSGVLGGFSSTFLSQLVLEEAHASTRTLRCAGPGKRTGRPADRLAFGASRAARCPGGAPMGRGLLPQHRLYAE